MSTAGSDGGGSAADPARGAAGRTTSNSPSIASVTNRVRGTRTYRSPVRAWPVTWNRSGWSRCSSSFARVIATYSSRRSSSTPSAVPVARSEGMQPSTTFST